MSQSQRRYRIVTWGRLPATSVSATLHLDQLTPRVAKVVKDNLRNGLCSGRGDTAQVTNILAEQFHIPVLRAYSGYVNISPELVLARPDPIGWLTQLEAILKVDQVHQRMTGQSVHNDIGLVEKFQHWQARANRAFRNSVSTKDEFPSYLHARTSRGQRDLHRAMAFIRTEPEMQRLTAFLSDWESGRITTIHLGTE